MRFFLPLGPQDMGYHGLSWVAFHELGQIGTGTVSRPWGPKFAGPHRKLDWGLASAAAPRGARASFRVQQGLDEGGLSH